MYQMIYFAIGFVYSMWIFISIQKMMKPQYVWNYKRKEFWISLIRIVIVQTLLWPISILVELNLKRIEGKQT